MWKIVVFIVISVLLVLLFVILVRMFQIKFKVYFFFRGFFWSFSSDFDFVVVDGVFVMFLFYDEVVSGGLSVLGFGYLVFVGQGCFLFVDDQSFLVYFGLGDMDIGLGQLEVCDSVLGFFELFQSLYLFFRC